MRGHPVNQSERKKTGNVTPAAEEEDKIEVDLEVFLMRTTD